MNLPLTEKDRENLSPIEIMENARKEADKIIRKAKLEYDEIFAKVEQERQAWAQERKLLMDEAQKEGYQHGWNVGKQEGYSQYREHLDKAKEITSSAVNDYHALLESSEVTILDLAVNIAEKIMDSEIDKNNEFFLSLLKKAVKEVKEHQNVQIYVYPDSYHFILERKEELLSVFPHQINLLIYPDDNLPKGGCVIESDFGRIDCSINTQLSEIKRKLGECLERE